jgi:GcrA cell cycle regulator
MALWTEAEDATLKQMYEQEYSCSQIAGRLSGKTRNAVIGRVHRLGLPRRGAGIAPARARKERRERSPRRRRVAMAAPPPQEIKLRCAAIEPRHATIEGGLSGCRWPYGDGPFTFCDHPKTEGSSYCADHFFLSIGAGTPSENAATRISRRKLEGAW